MEWLSQLQGQVVGLDTAPLIYFIEQNEVSQLIMLSIEGDKNGNQCFFGGTACSSRSGDR